MGNTRNGWASIRKKLSLLSIGVLLLCVPQAAYAQRAGSEAVVQEEREAAVLPPVVVEAKRVEWDVLIPEEEIIKRAGLAQTVDSLLENEPGIFLRRSGFGRSESEAVSIRGFDTSRIQVLMDGRSLSGSGVYGGYYVDWGTLSLEDIESIEIKRGITSARYGNTLGGVINIVTKKGSDEPKTEFRGTGGSYDTWQGMLSHAWHLGQLYYSLSIGHYETSGYLRNSFVDRELFSGSFSYHFTDETKLNFSARYTDNEVGIIVYNQPDSPYFDPNAPLSNGAQLGGPFVLFRGWQFDYGNNSYWKDKRGQFDSSLHTVLGPVSLKIGGYLNTESRTEYFYAIDDIDKLVLIRHSRPEQDTWGWYARGEQNLRNHFLQYGTEGAYYGYGPIEVPFFDPAYFWWPPEASPGIRPLELVSAYAQDKWGITERVALDFGLRYDDYSYNDPPYSMESEDLSANAGVIFHPLEELSVELRGALAHRYPNNPEAYWFWAGFQPPERGNLKPEEAIQWDLDISYHFAKSSKIYSRFYYYDVDDYIRTIFGYHPTTLVYNIDKVQFRGIELGVEHEITDGLWWFANWTTQRTEKEGDILDMSIVYTKSLTELPENTANAGMRYKWGKDKLVGFNVRFVGEREMIVGDRSTAFNELRKMDSFVTVDLQGLYPVFSKGRYSGTVRLSIENLFNENYEELYGFKMPGRTFMGTFSLLF